MVPEPVMANTLKCAERLYYQMVYDDTTDYDKAPAVEEETRAFRMSLPGEQATFKMKGHYATVPEARTERPDHYGQGALWRRYSRFSERLKVENLLLNGWK
jgi:hypothetical protein